MKRYSFLAGLVVITMTAGMTIAASGNASVGAVYTMSNAPGGNQVLVFDRHADGTLAAAGAFGTGGAGTGGGLGNQGAVVLNEDREWLLAVNAAPDAKRTR